MYDFYPDSWGPAVHDPESPRSNEALAAAADMRDSSGPRPDDN